MFLQHVEEDSRTDRTREFSREKLARGDSSCLVTLFCSFFHFERSVILSIQLRKRRMLLHTQNKHVLTKRDPRRWCLLEKCLLRKNGVCDSYQGVSLSIVHWIFPEISAHNSIWSHRNGPGHFSKILDQCEQCLALDIGFTQGATPRKIMNGAFTFCYLAT